MLLLPIGRDQTTIQRHAWVSYSIIIANIFFFVITMVISTATRTDTRNAVETALHFLVQHPYLNVRPDFARLLPHSFKEGLQNARVAIPVAAVREGEQAELDRLVDTAMTAFRRFPPFAFGFIPAEGRPWTLITSMFIHGGLFHLFGNMLFFFLSGPFVEDVYGRPLFAVLYGTGGLAAAFTFWARHPESNVPLIGASGAIAAVMGAYLVRFVRSKIEFIYIPFWFMPTRNVRFFAPAWVVLLLWFGQQFMEMQSEATAGVAFSAHVGGFLYGVVFAGAVKITGFEEKHVAPKILAEISLLADPRLERAVAARDQQDYVTAKKEVESILRERPQDIDALQTGVSIARLTEDAAFYDTCQSRLLVTLIQSGETTEAVDIVREVMLEREVGRMPRLAAKSAAWCEQEGHRDWALLLYEKLARADGASAAAIGSMLKISSLRKANGDLAGAREILQKAQTHPACSGELAARVEAHLRELSGAAAPVRSYGYRGKPS